MRFTDQTRIFITGCGGMLGDAVYAHFSPICKVLATDINTSEPWLTFGDVRNCDQIHRLIREFSPNLVINLAALTDLEACETDPSNAWSTNALGAENVGLAARSVGASYVYISTAGIFDGEKELYTDFDDPNPLSQYAKSKYYGEQWTSRSIENHFVLRAGWMMGGGRKDKKFVRKIYGQLIAGAKTIFAVTDKLGTPTYTVDFAKGIQRVVESGFHGIYNQVCSGLASRYDVAVAIVNELGCDATVEPVDSSHFKEYFAARPASEQLDNTKLRARGIDVMRNWRVCLKEYLAAQK